MIKRGLLMFVISAVISAAAFPSCGESSQQKISDKVFTKLCKSGTAKNVKYAITSKGANVNARIKREGFEYDNTMLICAAGFNKDPEVVKALIAAGADVNAKNWYRRTALMYAAGGNFDEAKRREDPGIVKALIAGGADVNAKDADGWTALMFADNPETVKALVSAGADVNAKADGGWTALLGAAGGGNLEVVKILISAGADVNAKDFGEWGSAEVDIDTQREIYLDMSAAIKAREENEKHEASSIFSQENDDGDFTVLMHVADGDNPEIVKALISAGADLEAKDPLGRTALMIAAKWAENSEILAVLIKAGSLVNLRDKEGNTPLKIAQEREDSEIKTRIIAMLKQAGAKE